MQKYLTLLAAPIILLASCNLNESKSDSAADAPPNQQWNVDNVSASKANKLIQKNPDIVVLDVRTPDEFSQGHIKGAINVDYKSPDFADNVAKLDNTKIYLLHCRSGSRSSKSLPVLKKHNFGIIYHLDKGFNAWKSTGFPVEK